MRKPNLWLFLVDYIDNKGAEIYFKREPPAGITPQMR